LVKKGLIQEIVDIIVLVVLIHNHNFGGFFKISLLIVVAGWRRYLWEDPTVVAHYDWWFGYIENMVCLRYIELRGGVPRRLIQITNLVEEISAVAKETTSSTALAVHPRLAVYGEMNRLLLSRRSLI
jgi:hypothetical protein